MNIFKILGNGDGRIHEPNVSSFLGYLLDPSEDHGLGQRFLSLFLEITFPEIKPENISTVVVELEVKISTPSGAEKQTRHLDIKLSLNTKDNKLVLIYIENKIRISSTDNAQLEDIRKSLNDFRDSKKYETADHRFIYITPNHPKCNSAFENVKTTDKEMKHVYWESNMLNLLKSLTENNEIKKDRNYCDETILSFVEFIKMGFRSQETIRKLFNERGFEESIAFLRRHEYTNFIEHFTELNTKLKIIISNKLGKTDLDDNVINYITNEKQHENKEMTGKMITLIKPGWKPYRTMDLEKFARFKFGRKSVTIDNLLFSPELTSYFKKNRIKYHEDGRYKFLLGKNSKFDSTSLNIDLKIIELSFDALFKDQPEK